MTTSAGAKAEIPNRNVVRRVCYRLAKTHGRSRFGNPRDALDDLIYIILSNRTEIHVAQATFRKLMKRFTSWAALVASKPEALRAVLRPAGLSRKKTSQIRAILRRIHRDYGVYSLQALDRQTDEDVLEYLTGLKGVSHKVARCVMMYALDRNVLPVDAHVFRIACRLGWTTRKRADQCYQELERAVPAELRFTFHVTCIAHGRTVCKSTTPKCDSCCILPWCPTGKDFHAERSKADCC